MLTSLYVPLLALCRLVSAAAPEMTALAVASMSGMLMPTSE